MVYLKTNIGKRCPLPGCDEFLEEFDKSCNHLLKHGLKCLHVGQETSQDDSGKLWQNTVAVFGK